MNHKLYAVIKNGDILGLTHDRADADGDAMIYAAPVFEMVPVTDPVPTRLKCPECGDKHIDGGEWKTKIHKTHLCETCGAEWRPYPYPTVGV